MSEPREGSAEGLEEPPPPLPPLPPEPEPADEAPAGPPFLVWIDGLPVSKEFNFDAEYVQHCQETYPDFVKSR